MSNPITRRESLGLTAAGFLALAAEWATPALAQGETDVPFTDVPATFNTNAANGTRMLDLRKIDGPFTAKDSFSPSTISTARRLTATPTS